VEPSPDQQLQLTTAGRRLSDLTIVWGTTGGHPAPWMIDNLEIKDVPFAEAGSTAKSQCNAEAAVSYGEAIVTPRFDLVWVTFVGRSQNVSIALPPKLLMPLIPHEEDIRIPQDNDVLRLLKSYVNTLVEAPLPASPELRRLIAAHIHDLVALMIGATRPSAAISQRWSMREARLRAIKADIAAHIRQQELTIGAVAARQHISARYVQRLFEGETTTFSRFVLDQRLALAECMLTDSRYDGWTISAIAMEAGFGDLSYFDHAFRRTFASSPSEVRSAARKAHDIPADFVPD
jgi:AraC-like DNA-binding protein